MDRHRSDESAARFSAYLDELASEIGHASRVEPLRDYCAGLLLPGERKSVEPMAAITAPSRVSAQHQSLLHFVGKGGWSDDKLLARIRKLVLPKIEQHGAIAAWIIDDTGMPKHGRYSVGVARQYCGQLGKQDNCQVAVSLSVANHHASLPVAYRLYLPQDWATDEARRRKVGIPDDIVFKTKPEIALEQIRWACDAGLPRGVVLIDAGYGADTELRSSISALNLTYVVGIRANTSVDVIKEEPEENTKPASVEAVARGLPETAWLDVEWRDGTNAPLSGRFARLRVRPTHGGEKATAARAAEWLLIEWPKEEKKPTKYWLSTLADDIDIVTMVDMAKLRWRIERDYLELKQEVGLGHFEGRGWRGFHHHATLCIAAYGFLISERGAFPPSGHRSRDIVKRPAVPAHYRPRGAAAAT